MSSLRLPKSLQTGISILLVFAFTNLAWVFFRSPDFGIAVQMLKGMAGMEGFSFVNVMNKFIVLKGCLLIGLMLTVEVSNFKLNYNSLILGNPVFRVASFAVLLWLIATFGTFGSNAFIYFQF